MENKEFFNILNRTEVLNDILNLKHFAHLGYVNKLLNGELPKIHFGLRKHLNADNPIRGID